jgi:hypothetical protein
MIGSNTVHISTHNVDRGSCRMHGVPRRAANGDKSSWSRKCFAGREPAYAYQNLKPRYRYNPGRWLGDNHHRYRDVLNCHRRRHCGMPGKSTLGRLVQLLNAARLHVSEPVANGLSRQRNVIATSKNEVVNRRFRQPDWRLICSSTDEPIEVAVREPCRGHCGTWHARTEAPQNTANTK